MEINKDYSIFGKNLLYFIGVAIVTQLIGFIQFPIITKSIGAASYGIFSIITTTVALLTPFAVMGHRSGIIRFLAAEKDPKKIRDDFISEYIIVVISGLILSALLFISADFLARDIMNDESASHFIRIASLLVLFNATFDISVGFFSSQHKLGLRASIVLSKDALQFILIILFINLKMNLEGIILALIASGLIINSTSLIVILKKTGFSLPSFKNTLKYLKWGLPLIPVIALIWIINLSDRYMVSYFINVGTAGIYSAAYTIGNYTSFLLYPIGLVLYPNVIKTYDEKKYEETRRYLKYAMKYLFMITIPAAFGISVLSQPILRILTSQEFMAGSIIIPIIATSALFYCLYQISVYIIHARNKTYISLVSILSAAVLNIILNIILIPYWGILGAALATLIAYITLGILSLLIAFRYLKFDLSFHFLVKCILSSIVMGVCVWLINPKSLLLLIISIIAGALIYFIVLFLIRGFTKNEINFFAHFVKDNLAKLKIGSK